MSATFSVEMKNISKFFPGIVANKCVNFNLRPGEIHALLGENGAGKSTLMNILAGVYRPDEGEIYLSGGKCFFKSPLDSSRAGIGMVHQHFMLVKSHTVIENLMLGLEGEGFFINRKKIEKKVSELSSRYGFEINPELKIWQLSVGEQQKVEILKALLGNANVLILDEPTAVLTPDEITRLFEVLEELKKEGRSTVFITHKIEEVMRIADRITILKEGKLIDTMEKRSVSKIDLARKMVGREVLFDVKRKEGQAGSEVLRVENVEANNDRGLPALRGISLSIKSGEILGVAGVAGNGQKELAEVLFGLRKIQKGGITLAGEDISKSNPKKIRKSGASLIPEDRIGSGLVVQLDFCDNLILGSYGEEPVSSGIFINNKKVKEWANEVIPQYGIKVGSIKAPVWLLSGGNLQKLLLARELSGNRKLIIASCPTRGLDIGATENIWNFLIGERDRGAAILMISEDLDEIFHVSDRIAVIYEGKILDTLDPEKTDVAEIGLLMGGVKKEAENADLA